MNITIITIGEPQLSFAREGVSEYYKRIQRFANVELIHIKEGKSMEDKVLKLLSKKFVVLMDERDKEYSSFELSQFLDKQKMQGRDLCFLIGGPNGHSESIREKADVSISLSRLTFPHDIAMLVTLETLYRSLSILENHPYHRV